MTRKRVLFGLALACLMAVAACAPPPLGYGGTLAPGPGNRIVIYTSHKYEVYWPIIKEFEERTGIWVDIVYGGTTEMLERIEREAYDPQADVMFGGGAESLESFSECFTPYVTAEAGSLMPQYRSDGRWTAFSSLPLVLIYNTKLVAPQRLTRWADLFEEGFQGRIAFADPNKSGSCFTALVTLTLAMPNSREETMRAFAGALGGRLLSNSSAVLTSVADGVNLVGVTLEETALQRIAAGDNIALVYPADGTSFVPDGSALVRGAPHPANARRFIDFIAGKDVQNLLQERFFRRPARADVAPGALTAKDEIPFVEYDVAWVSENYNAFMTEWDICLAELKGA